MKHIGKKFKFKRGKWTDPEIYLRANIDSKTHNGVKLWTMSSREYLKAAIIEVESKLKKEGRKLPTKAKAPIASNYKAELDETTELKREDITYYQELIGIVRLSTEIGRVDILLEVALLSTYQASPRIGHMEQLLHIFAFIKYKPKLTIYFDPNIPPIDSSIFKMNAGEFKAYYRDTEGKDPPRMPRPKGRSVKMTAFVDASHGANKVTRRSHTGYILFLNRAPITWYSKRQNTVETSTFSSEFIALKSCMEGITTLRYKLNMFGVPIDGPADVLCDNQSVVNNTSNVESKLN